MEMNFSEIQKIIREFIAKNGEEIKLRYNISLSEESTEGKAETLESGLIYIGDWRLEKDGDNWTAVFNEQISEEEDIEVVLEINITESGYNLGKWYVQQVF